MAGYDLKKLDLFRLNTILFPVHSQVSGIGILSNFMPREMLPHL